MQSPAFYGKRNPDGHPGHAHGPAMAKTLRAGSCPAPNKTRDMRNSRLRTASMKNTLKSSVPGRFLLPRCAGEATERRSKNALYKRQPAPLLQGKLVHSTAGCAISPEAIWPLRIQGEKKVMPGSIAAQVFTGFPRIREQRFASLLRRANRLQRAEGCISLPTPVLLRQRHFWYSNTRAAPRPLP